MHNYKKLIAIPLIMVTLFASCSKTLNAEGAKKYVESQYSSITTKTFNGVSVIASTKPDTSEEVKKEADSILNKLSDDFGLTYDFGSYSLRGNAVVDSPAYKSFNSLCTNKIVANDIDKYEETKEIKGADATITYTTNSGELGIYTNFKNITPVQPEETNYKTNELDIYNTCGQLRYLKFYGNCTHEGHELSFSFIFEMTFAA